MLGESAKVSIAWKLTAGALAISFKTMFAALAFLAYGTPKFTLISRPNWGTTFGEDVPASIFEPD
jgi:hypothetical protein